LKAGLGSSATRSPRSAARGWARGQPRGALLRPPSLPGHTHVRVRHATGVSDKSPGVPDTLRARHRARGRHPRAPRAVRLPVLRRVRPRFLPRRARTGAGERSRPAAHPARTAASGGRRRGEPIMAQSARASVPGARAGDTSLNSSKRHSGSRRQGGRRAGDRTWMELEPFTDTTIFSRAWSITTCGRGRFERRSPAA
jgi:hypothetical protein